MEIKRMVFITFSLRNIYLFTSNVHSIELWKSSSTIRPSKFFRYLQSKIKLNVPIITFTGNTTNVYQNHGMHYIS